MKTIRILLLLIPSFLVSAFAEARIWKNANGVEITAEMTGMSGNKVLLRLKDGRVVPYPLAQLSAEDQEFARKNPVAAAQGDWKKGMTKGSLSLQSAGQLAFGPAGILFIGDSRAGAIVALATEDTGQGGANDLKIEGIDQKLAALLGTSVDQLLIQDIAVHPISKNVYLAVSRGTGPDGTPVLAKVDSKAEIEVVSLDSVLFSRAELPDPAEGRQRQECITDIAFFQDRVLVAGLSNEEFSSSFRAIPFPFASIDKGTGVEIFHGAHGQFETRSPVRTFLPFEIGGKPSLLAAYTCTPLVQIPLEDLSPGAKIRGKTVAELGGGNRPLDMILYEKAGKQYVLMANSKRGIMKFATDGIEEVAEITAKTGIAGHPYETISDWVGVDQLDTFNTDLALTLRREGTALHLETLRLP